MEEGQKFRASYSGTNAAADPFSAIVQVLGAPQELATFFKKLQKVSPDDIEPDVEVMQKAFQKIADESAQNGMNPLGGLLEAIMLGASTKGATDRIDAYTAANCGPLPGADTDTSATGSGTTDTSGTDSTGSDPSPSPTPSRTRTGPPQPGEVAFGSSEKQTMCPEDFADEEADNDSKLTLLQDGIVAFHCDGKVHIHDLATGVTSWSLDLTNDQMWSATDQHLFVLTATEVEESGLNAAATTYELTAHSMADGSQAWKVPLKVSDDDESSANAGDFRADESTDPGAVVVGFSGTTAFDPDNGEELWHTTTRYHNPEDDAYGLTAEPGTYVGHGVAVTVGENDDYAQQLEGRNAKTGKLLWAVDPPKSEGGYAGHCTNENRIEGTSLWCGYGNWWETVHITSGKVLDRFILPAERCEGGASCYTSPYGILVANQEKETLDYYSDGDTEKPKWSVSASVRVVGVALGRTNLLVQAGEKPLLLSAEDGSEVELAEEPTGMSDESHSLMVDGFARLWFDGQSDATIVAVDPAY